MARAPGGLGLPEVGIAPAMTFTPAPPAPRSSARPGPSDSEADVGRLRITLTWTTWQCVVSLAGALDADSAVALGAEYDQLVRAGVDEVVIDVGLLHSIDGAGGVALAELWARLRDDGVFCRVRGLHPVFGDNPLELLLYLRDAGPHVLRHVLAPMPATDQSDVFTDPRPGEASPA